MTVQICCASPHRVDPAPQPSQFRSSFRVIDIPGVLRLMHSAWLNEAATLFRRKSHKSDSHDGSPRQNANVDKLRQAMPDSKGQSVHARAERQDARDPDSAGVRCGLKGAGYPNTLDHEAMSPNHAIVDQSCYFGKWGSIPISYAAFTISTDEKKPAFPYENREKRVLYYDAIVVLSARSRKLNLLNNAAFRGVGVILA